jgi:hypothetical protein
MRARGVLTIASLLLLLFAVSGAAASPGRAASAGVSRGTCTVELPGFGAVNGRGTLVTSASSQIIFVCNLNLSNPPANMIVETFPGTGGNVVVVTVSGRAVVVFTPSP